MDYPKDYYYSIEAGGEFVEGHILMTTRQSRYMEKALKKRMLDLGYSRAIFTVMPGGEFDYTFDEDDDDYEKYAAEIVKNAGYTIQPGSTLKEEE
jgi:hypothetical protein